MGINDNITSPTFILMRDHSGSPGLCHADAYRLGGPAEFEELGIEDALKRSVLAVEWAERVLDALPEERIDVVFQCQGEDVRRMEFRIGGERLRVQVQGAFT